jgi:shikimate dehydrogenase
MKKYLVIGNPIDHSLSPKLHNFWIRENNIKAVYNKKLLQENEVEELISEMRNNRINGINITVPFKKSIIPFLDELTPLAKKAQSVNTIFKSNNRIMGDNTDIGGFESSLKHINYNVKNKKIFILGAGGVVTSIILALTNLGASQISLSNRTIEKAEIIKKNFPSLKIVEWGKYNDFDIIINATSVGLKKEDQIKLDLSKIEPNKLFYDVIYNPSKTNFLLQGEKLGHKTENGKMMFIYQAQLAFKIWHNILPKIKNNLLD